MNPSRPLVPTLALLALAGAAQAQSFNVDVGPATPFGHPSNAYGAAAGQPGFWNPAIGGPPYQVNVQDLTMAATTVSTDVVNTGTGSGDFSANNGATNGDDEALLDDFEDVGGVGSFSHWTFSGLDDGSYDIYTYTWASDNPAYRTEVTVVGSGDVQLVGFQGFPGTHVLGGTYARHCWEVVNGADVVVEIRTFSGLGSVNGFQFVKHTTPCGSSGPGAPFCDCTGGSPCGLSGGPGRGCPNGSDPTGALLEGSGQPTVGADTVVLEGSGLVPNQPGLYFQGDNAINGGSGVPFGDGIRCAGMNVIRLEVRVADASGASATTVSVSTKGQVQAGDTKHYQLWYRGPAGTPCGTTFNLTNGYTIVWN